MGHEPDGASFGMTSISAIKSVMTPSPLTIAIDAPVQAAEDLMIDRQVRHLPVVEAGSLVGIVSDRDIAFLENDEASDLRHRLRVRDVCSLDVYAIGPDEPLDRVLKEMANRRIGSAIVVEDGRVLGLFTATDACRCFADLLETRLRAPGDELTGS